MENESGQLSEKELFLQKAPFLKTFLAKKSYDTVEDWLTDADEECRLVYDEIHKIYGNSFSEMGPKGAYIAGESFHYFNDKMEPAGKFGWTCWLVALGWELKTDEEIGQFLTDIIDVMSDLEVFNPNLLVEEGPSSEQTRFTWSVLNLGAHWRNLTQSNRLRPFEDFVSNIDIDLGDDDNSQE